MLQRCDVVCTFKLIKDVDQRVARWAFLLVYDRLWFVYSRTWDGRRIPENVQRDSLKILKDLPGIIKIFH